MKKFLLSLLLVAFMGPLFAEKVELQDAKNYAVNAYYQKLNLYHHAVSIYEVQIDDVFDIKKDGESVYYIFNMKDFGYIIISAEDVLNPVQAYSFTSTYIQGKYSDNFNGWLDGRAGAVVYARENNIMATDEINAKWNELKDISSLSLIDNGKSVEPLLTSTWNQDWPYNYYMPLNASGPGGRMYVGCVSTAMSMIMHYWRYPAQGSGSKTHSYAGHTVTVNYADAEYDWDAMLDNSDNRVNLEMAEIGLHAAVAVEMHWGPNGSGAYSSDVPYALETYFNYDTDCQYIQNQGYPWSTWKGYIEAELDDICPLYYSGQDGNGPGASGHAFVLDGYHSDDTYHFNFGWSGYGNGWFDITSPSGYEWYYNQGMVRSIYPEDSNYPYGCTNDYERHTLVGSLEDGSGPTENYNAYADCAWLISSQTAQDSVDHITLEFVLMDTETDDVFTIYDGASTSDPVLGTYSGTSVPTEQVTSTGNQMLITFVADGDATTGTGWKVEYFSTQPSYCSPSVVTLTEPAGTIGDGSESFYYKNNTNCMWKIEPAYATGVTLTFTDFDTEDTEDYLQVYDASNNQLQGEFSGNTLPDAVHVESGELFLIWKTSGAITAPGWEAFWEADNVGVEEQSNSFTNLMVYPNPANDVLKVSFTTDENQSFDVSLITVTGIQVYTESTNEFSGNYVNSIDLSEFSEGVYFLNITSESGTVVRKVVVQ